MMHQSCVYCTFENYFGKNMSDENSFETRDNTNNSSIDNTQDANIKKGIKKCKISTIASAKNNSIGVNNEVDIITNDSSESAIVHPNEHHIPTSNTSQQGYELENAFKKKKIRSKFDW